MSISTTRTPNGVWITAHDEDGEIATIFVKKKNFGFLRSTLDMEPYYCKGRWVPIIDELSNLEPPE